MSSRISYKITEGSFKMDQRTKQSDFMKVESYEALGINGRRAHRQTF